MIKCPNCGTMNEAGSRFCFQCGQTLSTDGQAGGPGATQPISPPSFPAPGAYPGTTGPVSGYPPPPPAGFPPQGGYQDQSGYGQGNYGGYPPPGGYPVGTPGYLMPPEPPRRRRWLWIVLGIILGCVLICVAFGIWGFTAGEDTFSRWGTEISEYSTEEAN